MKLSVVRDLSPIGTVGRYDILGRLAVGGMAEIFLARETGPRATSRVVVVKRVLPHVADQARHVESFVQEASLCMTLRHRGIPAIYEFGEDDGTFYLAMELVHGVSLRALVSKAAERRGVPLPFVARIGADVAAALGHAHGATDADGRPLGLVHRDVTPENVMVGFDGSVKLLDFGIAKVTSAASRTQNGELKGKFAYMSPEQYRSDPLDARSDVFSLGVCVYEALSGSDLFRKDTEYETVAAIVLEDEVPSIRSLRADVPEALEALVHAAIRKNRDVRLASAVAFEQGLAGWLHDHGHLVSARDLGAYVKALFPERVDAPPELDRHPLRRRQAVDAITAAHLAAEVDDIEDELGRGARRKRVTVRVLGGLLVLGALAGVGWAVSHGPPTTTMSDTPLTESTRTR